MLIGIDASRANKRVRTGTEWYSFYLMKRLAVIDKDNTYVWYIREDLKKDFFPVPDNVRIKVLKWPLKYMWTHFRLSAEMLLHPPDLLFVPAHAVPLFHPKNTIVTIHDLGFERCPELYHPLARAYHRVSGWYSARCARHIITISDFSRRDIMRFFKIAPEKVSVIPLGIDKELFCPCSEREVSRALAPYQLRPRQYILYVGRLEKKKNLPVLVKAFAAVRKNHPLLLVLVGRPGYGYEQIAEAMEKEEVKEHIHILEGVPRTHLPFFYQGALALIHPSRFEGFGLTPVEAMACLCPAIVARTTSLPEVVGDAGWYFDPGDYVRLQKLVALMYEREDLRRALIQKGAVRARQFSWDKTARRTLEVFKKIVH